MKKRKLNISYFHHLPQYRKINSFKPINEKFRSKPITLYGKTKLMAEKLLKKTKFKSIILRYFNVSWSNFGNLYRQNLRL